MTALRTALFGLAATVAVGLVAPPAPAGDCSGPFCNQPKSSTLFGYLAATHQPKPTFQAAPWYLYWPYDAHFLTPAPIGGAFYGPPNPGNYPVNPYFPQPALPYGPIPGGMAPPPLR